MPPSPPARQPSPTTFNLCDSPPPCPPPSPPPNLLTPAREAQDGTGESGADAVKMVFQNIDEKTDGVITINALGTIQMVNRGLLRLLGYKKGLLEGALRPPPGRCAALLPSSCAACLRAAGGEGRESSGASEAVLPLLHQNPP